jgi:Rap1a immunity proteins
MLCPARRRGSSASAPPLGRCAFWRALGLAAWCCAAPAWASAAPTPTAGAPGADNVNLSATAFFASYTSADAAERQRANLHMLGVLDATEGRSWCDDKALKTVTLREFVFEHFKKLPPERLKDRAAKTIEEALASRFARRKQQKRPGAAREFRSSGSRFAQVGQALQQNLAGH